MNKLGALLIILLLTGVNFVSGESLVEVYDTFMVLDGNGTQLASH